MKIGLTEIVVILDRSGSMNTRRDETITGFNAFVEAQQKGPGEARLTLIQFDDQYEPNYEGKDIREVPQLTLQTYIPRGYTALHDAIGRTILGVGARLAAQPEEVRPEKVLIQVITDGYENASHEYTRDKLKAMIQHQEEQYHWLFTFMGTNQDAVLEAASFGIASGQSMSYGMGTVGTANMFAGMSVNTMRARSSYGAAGMKAAATYTTSEKAAAAQEDKDIQGKDKDQWPGKGKKKRPPV